LVVHARAMAATAWMERALERRASLEFGDRSMRSPRAEPGSCDHLRHQPSRQYLVPPRLDRLHRGAEVHPWLPDRGGVSTHHRARVMPVASRAVAEAKELAARGEAWSALARLQKVEIEEVLLRSAEVQTAGERVRPDDARLRTRRRRHPDDDYMTRRAIAVAVRRQLLPDPGLASLVGVMTRMFHLVAAGEPEETGQVVRVAEGLRPNRRRAAVAASERFPDPRRQSGIARRSNRATRNRP
jgi:hypothetical protein